MTIKPIHTEEDYLKALDRLEEIFNAEIGTESGDELEILSVLIERYEEERFPIDLPDPISAIEFRMEQLGMKPKDLAEVVGYKSRVSELLSKKRKLSLAMIRKISVALGIPAEVLVQDY